MARTTYGGATPHAVACGHAPLVDCPQLLTIDQAAEYLGTGQRFVRRLISVRRISYVKLGKYVRRERGALDVFVAAGRVSVGCGGERSSTEEYTGGPNWANYV